MEASILQSVPLYLARKNIFLVSLASVWGNQMTDHLPEAN